MYNKKIAYYNHITLQNIFLYNNTLTFRHFQKPSCHMWVSG